MPTRKAAPRKAPPKKKTANVVKAGTSKEAADTRKRLFAEAYIANGGNGSEAAKAAGYSAHSAPQQASRLLKDANVSQLIADRSAKLAAKFELTTESVLRSLSQAVHFDPRKLYREDGSLKSIHELDDDTAMALTGVETIDEFATAPLETELERQAHGGGLKRQHARAKVLASRTAKVKWLDKNVARDQAMKHLGLFKADNTQRTLLGDVPRDKLKAIVARLAGG